MNVYVVVEGRVVEKAVYKQWIPEVNPKLQYVEYPAEVGQNNFLIISGNGYPQYFDTIQAGLEDVASDPRFSRLVISIDAEGMSNQDKYDEVEAFIAATGIKGVDYRIVVQYFCFETWALGNRRIGARHPKHPELADLKRHYDVVRLDPEGLTPPPGTHLNRSQLAEKYLRLTLNDKNKNLTYSKNRPDVVAHPKYYSEVRKRLGETGHIASFEAFLKAFQ